MTHPLQNLLDGPVPPTGKQKENLSRAAICHLHQLRANRRDPEENARINQSCAKHSVCPATHITTESNSSLQTLQKHHREQTKHHPQLGMSKCGKHATR